MERLEKCKVSDICGGCQLQHLDYQQQLELKQQRIERLFSKIKKVEPIIVKMYQNAKPEGNGDNGDNNNNGSNDGTDPEVVVDDDKK